MSDRIRFSNRRQLIEEELVQDVRDDVAAVLEDLDQLLAHDSDDDRREDAETRRAVLEGLNGIIRNY